MTSSGNPGVGCLWIDRILCGRLADDFSGDIDEVTNDVFQGQWQCGFNSDGAVIGELNGHAWSIRIDTILYSGLADLIVVSADGSTIPLSLITGAGGIIELRPILIPPAFWLLGSGLLGLIGTAKKRAS